MIELGRGYRSALSGRGAKTIAIALTRWGISPRDYATPEQLQVLNGEDGEEKDKVLATLLPFVEQRMETLHKEYSAALKRKFDEWWEARRNKQREPSYCQGSLQQQQIDRELESNDSGFTAPDGTKLSRTGQRL